MGNVGLENISRLGHGTTRCVTPENVYGEKGKGGMAEISDIPQPEVVRIGQKWQHAEFPVNLGRKWKVRPSILIEPRATATIMDAAGPGVIQHIWLTVIDVKFYRDFILRVFWDNEPYPSVETPLGDFFCNSFAARTNILALPINVNPSGGFNCFFPMPFRQNAKITIENTSPDVCQAFYYAITYALGEFSADQAYFHAQFRHANPLPCKEDYVIAEGIKGQGHYVGCFLAWQQHHDGWWGEGEAKMFIDGDTEFPTICGTGTEDYFGGAWGFGENFSAPFFGYYSNERDGKAGNRHGLYRFHILDPIRFARDFKITIQALGVHAQRYVHCQDNISSVAYWYQQEPHAR